MLCSFVCAYHTAALGSNPKHIIYAVSICIIEIVMRKEGKKRKEAGIGPFVSKNLLTRYLHNYSLATDSVVTYSEYWVRSIPRCQQILRFHRNIETFGHYLHNLDGFESLYLKYWNRATPFLMRKYHQMIQIISHFVSHCSVGTYVMAKQFCSTVLDQ